MDNNDYRDIFAENLNYYMEQNGVKQIDIAERLGISKSTVSSWCGGVKIPRMDKIEMLADYFGISKSALIEKRNGDIKGYRRPVPIRVAEKFIDDDVLSGTEGYEYVPEEDVSDGGEYVFFRACGDEMYPNIMDGDLVLVRLGGTVRGGEIAAVDEDGASRFRRVVYGEDYVELQPLNPMYPPKRYRDDNAGKARIWGEVRKIIREF